MSLTVRPLQVEPDEELYLTMPVAAGSGITMGKDGKPITVVDKTGWTWSYTLSAVM